MKRQIRRGVFETNSSSTHSLTWSRKSQMAPPSCLKVNDDGYVEVTFGEFGWEWDEYNDPIDKLSYLVTMIAETTDSRMRNNPDEIVESKEDFENLPDFRQVSEVVANYCDCDGITLLNDVETKVSNYGGKDHYYLEVDGYIDHQSCEGYNCIQDFLDDYGSPTLESYIFDYGISVRTGNDND